MQFEVKNRFKRTIYHILIIFLPTVLETGKLEIYYFGIVVEILASTYLFFHISNSCNTLFCLSYPVNDLFKRAAVPHTSIRPIGELLLSGLSVDDLHDKISSSNKIPSQSTHNLRELKLSGHCTLGSTRNV